MLFVPGPDSRIEKWRRWLTERVQPEVIGMNHMRRVYETVVEIIDRHGSLPASSVFNFIQDTYVSTQSVAVRRQAETGERVVSIGRLLTEISSEPERLTREWYVSLHDEDDQRYANEGWENSWFGGRGIDHVDPNAVLKDLDALEAASETVRRYVDRHVAHHDRDPAKGLPMTFAELNVAIDAIGDMFTRYAGLLTASHWVTLVPVVQYNWLAVFLEPWIKDDAVLFDIMSEHPVTKRRS